MNILSYCIPLAIALVFATGYSEQESSGTDTLEYLRPEPLSDTDNPEFPNAFFLRDLLLNEKYQELHKTLDEYQTAYMEGKGSEITVDSAYEVLGNPDPVYQGYYDAWVDAMPDTYTAYLARASYYHSLAYAKRGTAYAVNTRREQFEAMNKYHELAKSDLEAVIELNPDITIPYSLLVAIAGAGGSREERMEYLTRGLSAHPASYVIRRDMLYFLLPRWGGSYELIELFLKDTAQYFDENPDLIPLSGYLDYAKSWRTYDKKEYLKTIELTTSAISKGKKSWYHKKRADTFYSLKDYESAIIDYTNAMLLNPNDPHLYIWRARAHSRLGNIEETFEDYEYAVKLYPYHYEVRKYYAKELEYYKRYKDAIKSKEMALYHNPYDHRLLYEIGKIKFRRLGLIEEALPSFKKAILLEPGNHQYWYDYADALYQLRDCEAVNALDSYIKICETQKCFDKGINWAKKVNPVLRTRDCKNY